MSPYIGSIINYTYIIRRDQRILRSYDVKNIVHLTVIVTV